MFFSFLFLLYWIDEDEDENADEDEIKNEDDDEVKVEVVDED